MEHHSLPTYLRGHRLRAGDINRLSEAIEWLSRREGGHGLYSPSYSANWIEEDTKRWVKVTGNNGSSPVTHSFVEQTADFNWLNYFVDREGGVTSTVGADVYALPLYEINNKTVPTGTYVLAWRGTGDYYLCEYPSSGSQTYNSSDVVSFNAGSTLNLNDSTTVNTGTVTLTVSAGDTLTLSGNAIVFNPTLVTFSGAVLFANYFRWAVTHVTLNTNQNNYNLTAATVVLAINATASFNLTGLDNGVEGRIVWIVNTSNANTITLKHLDANSDAENRLYTPEVGDVLLGPGEAIGFVWSDKTAQLGSGGVNWWSLDDYTKPAGSDTQVQFNDGGVFGADTAFLWDKTNNRLQLGVPSSVTGALRLAVSGDANHSTIQAGDAPVSDVLYKWPADDPAATEVLTVTSFAGGVAVLEWAGAGGHTHTAVDDIGGSDSIAADDTWEDLAGCEFDLDDGTYLIWGDTNGTAEVSAGTPGTLSFRVRNVDDNVTVTSTLNFVSAVTTGAAYKGSCHTMRAGVVVTGGPKTFRAQGFRNSGPTWTTATFDTFVIGAFKYA